MRRHSTDQQADFACSPTNRQLSFMARNQLQPDHPVDFYEAQDRINKFVRFRRRLAPTDRQKNLLQGRGKWREGMTRGEAHDLIRQLFQA
jgi:hypothetical protein